MEVREIMSTDVVTLTPETPAAEARNTLLHYSIHEAPVVDDTGQMVGTVGFADMAGRPGKRVWEMMEADPVSVSEDAPIEEAAALMLDQMVRYVTVLEAGRVVGVVSTADMIQALLTIRERAPERNEVAVVRSRRIRPMAARRPRRRGERASAAGG